MQTEGKLLKEARQRLGWSQAAVAKKLGFNTPQYISNCERDLCRLSSSHFKLLNRMFGPKTVKQLIAIRLSTVEKQLKDGTK